MPTKILKCASALIAGAMLNSSCVSYYALQYNKDRAYKTEIAKMGYPKQAIVAYIDGDVRGVGIDITNLDAVTYDKNSIIVQLGAAISDIMVGYGTYVYLTKDIPEE